MHGMGDLILKFMAATWPSVVLKLYARQRSNHFLPRFQVRGTVPRKHMTSASFTHYTGF